jgi:hypothetical protein
LPLSVTVPTPSRMIASPRSISLLTISTVELTIHSRAPAAESCQYAHQSLCQEYRTGVISLEPCTLIIGWDQPPRPGIHSLRVSCRGRAGLVAEILSQDAGVCLPFVVFIVRYTQELRQVKFH